MIALRAQVPLGGRWSALGSADIGGIGAGSRLTWQVLAAVTWQATEGVSLQAGYRHLALDGQRGRLALGIAPGSPIIGATFRF